MIPDHVRRDLYAEILTARAMGHSTEHWVTLVCETVERHLEPYACLACVSLTRRAGVEQTCSWCAAGGGQGWQWRPPIVLAEDPLELLEPVPPPGNGTRSDVPPTRIGESVSDWWEVA